MRNFCLGYAFSCVFMVLGYEYIEFPRRMQKTQKDTDQILIANYADCDRRIRQVQNEISFLVTEDCKAIMKNKDREITP